MWLDRENEMFSLLGGENFTNKEVLLAHVYVIALICVCFLAEWISNL